MKITIESTSQLVELNGVPARLWQGTTESGIPVHAFITRLATDEANDQTEFERELQSHRPPSEEFKAYPLRLIL